MVEIRVNKLAKHFGRRVVFSNITFDLRTGDSLAVVGHNGSGKTTLLRILAGLTALTSGTAEIIKDEKKLDKSGRRHCLAYVGPELTLYDALTGWENLKFFAVMHGIRFDNDRVRSILDSFKIYDRRFDSYGAYSSGMKQRLKYAVALLNDPDILLLDEPTANLDDQGKLVADEIIGRQKERGIVIVATNEKGEYGLAERKLRLGG